MQRQYRLIARNFKILKKAIDKLLQVGYNNFCVT